MHLTQISFSLRFEHGRSNIVLVPVQILRCRNHYPCRRAYHSKISQAMKLTLGAIVRLFRPLIYSRQGFETSLDSARYDPLGSPSQFAAQCGDRHV